MQKVSTEAPKEVKLAPTAKIVEAPKAKKVTEKAPQQPKKSGRKGSSGTNTELPIKTEESFVNEETSTGINQFMNFDSYSL